MRERAVLVLSSLYIFFFLGTILHTSRNPVIIHKYSPKYFLFLSLMVLFFPPIFYLTYWLFKTSIVTFKGEKIELKPLKKITIAVILFLLIFFLPCELFLRYKYRNFESSSYKYTINSFHPFLQSQLTKTDGININSYGFRGEEISLNKSPGTYRIVVLGGSTVLNREVTFEKNAVRLLELKLRRDFPHRKIEVINAGKDWYTSEHSLIQYLFEIRDFKPDLVIMWHGINDLYNSCTPSKTEYGGFKRDYSHSLGAVANLVMGYFKPKPLISIKSVAFDFAIKGLEENLYSDIVLSVKEKIDGKFADSFKKGGKQFVHVSYFPSLEIYKRNLQQFVHVLHDDGVLLILGNQASLYKKSVTLDEAKRLIFPGLICKVNEKYYSMESLMQGLIQFNKTTEGVATDTNTAFINFDSKIPKNLEYFSDSVHYTEKGNALIANVLFNYIKDNNLIK